MGCKDLHVVIGPRWAAFHELTRCSWKGRRERKLPQSYPLQLAMTVDQRPGLLSQWPQAGCRRGYPGSIPLTGYTGPSRNPSKTVSWRQTKLSWRSTSTSLVGCFSP